MPIADSDIEPPEIIHHFKNLTVNTDPKQPSATVTWDEPDRVADNSGSVTLTSNYQSGDIFPIGSANVGYTAIDQSGNSVTVEFVVTVTGTTLYNKFQEG